MAEGHEIDSEDRFRNCVHLVAEAHGNRPPKEMFRGPNVLEVHEVFLSTDLETD